MSSLASETSGVALEPIFSQMPVHEHFTLAHNCWGFDLTSGDGGSLFPQYEALVFPQYSSW